MERADLVQHTSKRFNADLEKVLANALQMAQNVERQFQDSIKALVTADATLAARVVQGDDQVNDMEREIMRRAKVSQCRGFCSRDEVSRGAFRSRNWRR